MPITPIALGIRSNGARSQQASVASLRNCYAEDAGEEGKSNWIIYARDGLSNFGSALAGGAVRAMLTVDNTLYVVAGRRVYMVNSSGTATDIGGIPTDGRVYMARNRKVPPQIGIVTDGLYYIVESGVLTQVSDADLPPPVGIAYLDGYFVLPVSNGRFYNTGIDEGTTIDALDFGVAEAYPDEIVGISTLERELVLFGTTSIEWHPNTGNETGSPFTRSQAVEIGCLTGATIAKVDTDGNKALLWVASDHTVRRMSGYGGQVVSTNKINGLIRDLAADGEKESLSAFAWSAGGRFYYCLTCPYWTQIYDSRTGFWTDADSYGDANWRVGNVVQFADKLIASDASTGQLYVMSPDVYSEAGNHHVLEVVTPPVHAFPDRLLFNALFLDCETGVGTNDAIPEDVTPELVIDWSDDGGASFCTPYVVKVGQAGQRKQRIQIRRLGISEGTKGRSFRIRWSTATAKAIFNLSADVEKLNP